MNFYDEVYSQDKISTPSTGWIQWKGTDVCIDLHCVCGHHGHFDGDFFYFFECPSCHRKYAVGQNINLIPLNEGHIKEIAELWGFKTCRLEED